jgi:hypothetical protein
MENSATDYLKLEYGKLNGEILKLTDEIRIRERFAAAFAPLAGAWIFVQLFKEKGSSGFEMQLALIICAATFLITFLFGLSTFILYRNIRIAGKYLKTIEEHMLPGYENHSFGWERFYALNNKASLVKLAVINWIIYLILPVAMSVVVVCAYNG